MNIARKENHREVVAELTTLGTMSVFEENFSNMELKKLLFHNDKSKWISEEVGLPEKKAWLAGADTKTFNVGKTWHEQLVEAQGNVRSKYGSRITEVEKKRRNKMDAIEKQCTAKGVGRRGVHKATPHRSPSAPEPQNFTFIVHPPVPPCINNRPDSF